MQTYPANKGLFDSLQQWGNTFCKFGFNDFLIYRVILLTILKIKENYFN